MLKSSGLHKTAEAFCASARKKIILAAALSMFAVCSSPAFADYSYAPTIDSQGGLGLGSAYTFDSGDNYEVSTFNSTTNVIETQNYSVDIKPTAVNATARLNNTGDITESSPHLQHYFNRVHEGGTDKDHAVGSAIFNHYSAAQMGHIVGDFINNHCIITVTGAEVEDNSYAIHGGAVDNHGTMASITGDFIGNYGYSDGGLGEVRGGALSNIGPSSTSAYSNVGYIGYVAGNFIGNHLGATSVSTSGGAIYNSGTIGTLSGLFTGNYVETAEDKDAFGGALALVGSNGKITNLNADFVNNTAQTSGGAIYQKDAEITNLTGNFAGNKATTGDGGAIYNATNNDGDTITGRTSVINNMNSIFYQNTAGNNGGAIYNNNGAEISNTAGNSVGSFIKNEAGNNGGAIYNSSDSTVTLAQGTFTENTAVGDGGAIYNTSHSTLTLTQQGTFTQNTANQGGAIYNASDSTINIPHGTFTENAATGNGGAIYNTSGSTINMTDTEDTTEGSTFIANTAQNGGAIYNDSVLLNDQHQVTGPSVVVDASFINNTATGENGRGGAIYSRSDINLVADGHTNVIEGNTSSGSEAIYIESQDYEFAPGETVHITPNVNIIAINNGDWEIQDKISGNGTAGDYNVNLQGDGTGTVSLYNDVEGANLTVSGVRLNTVDNKIHDYTNINSFTLEGDSTMTIDVDLKNGDMDRFVADSYDVNNDSTLDISSINIINDVDTHNQVIEFADADLAESVTLFGGRSGSTHNITTPVRVYDFSYNINSTNGRGYLGYSSYFNPSVLVAPVVLQAGVQSAMNTTLQNAFSHADTYTRIPKFDRLTMMEQNKYADASTDFNTNLTTSLKEYNLKENRTTNQGVWFRPYAAFERIPLRHGPKVDSITYGAFIGFDSNFHEHRNGWHSVLSTYLGYNGGQLDFKNVDSSLNGGVLGITDTFYKNNFWTALTLSGGAMFSNSSTMYGHEDATSLYGGIGSKTGYNFEFKDGRYILQPVFQASYSFANMFDYTNAAGVRIDANPLHTVQINPSLRFIMNCKNGWQPYARMGMIWNIMNDTDVDAGGYHLPEMHIKPYFEYGLGIQKLYNHRFTGFGEAMLRHGGRNGIAMTFGFRYGLGREPGEDYKNMSGWEKFKAFFK